jgi:hypothetical protein
MAEELRHAAGHATYEVHEVLDEDPVVNLGILFRCTDYVGAVEFAFEYLASRDPRRDGTVSGLEVVKNDRGKRETVWTYSHASHVNRLDPVRKWGFDVTRNWHRPVGPVHPPRLGSRVTRRV